jgi:hypothetical protein
MLFTGLQKDLDFNFDRLIRDTSTILIPNLSKTSSNEQKDKQRQLAVARNRVGHEVANQEAFLDLMDVLDESRERKRRALAILHATSESDIGKSHFDWLRGYLQSTDVVLNNALGIMRVLFGHVYRVNE